MPPENDTKNVRNWLFFTAAMVFAMATIGAITRLTESGLSMVEWKPLIGAVPPLTQAQWDHVFDLYKATPQFQQVNASMDLAGFKHIFFWEWLHRLWGRTIGLVFALPLVWFWVRGKIPQGYKLKFIGVLILGGLQGALGWYMVLSGLVNEPAVSHFRLAAHLVLALVLMGTLLWLALDFVPQKKEVIVTFCRKRHGWIALAFVATTIIWGAFTAGKDGGMLYNTWPKMNEYWVPPEVTGLFSVLHDPAAIQFVHRWLAIATLCVTGSFAWRMKNAPLLGMMIVQVGLGISTLLSQVYIPLAAMHQAGAMIVLSLLIKQLHDLHTQKVAL